MALYFRYQSNKQAPFSLFTQLLGGGLFYSTLDLFRRVGIEEALKSEEANEFNKQLRKDDRHYDL